MHSLFHFLHGFDPLLGLRVQVEDHAFEVARLSILVNDRFEKQVHFVKVVELVVSPRLARKARPERRGNNVLNSDVDVLVQVALDSVALASYLPDFLVELVHGLPDSLQMILHLVVAAFFVLQFLALRGQTLDLLLAGQESVLVVAYCEAVLQHFVFEFADALCVIVLGEAEQLLVLESVLSLRREVVVNLVELLSRLLLLLGLDLLEHGQSLNLYWKNEWVSILDVGDARTNKMRTYKTLLLAVELLYHGDGLFEFLGDHVLAADLDLVGEVFGDVLQGDEATPNLFEDLELFAWIGAILIEHDFLEQLEPLLAVLVVALELLHLGFAFVDLLQHRLSLVHEEEADLADEVEPDVVVLLEAFRDRYHRILFLEFLVLLIETNDKFIADGTTVTNGPLAS